MIRLVRRKVTKRHHIKGRENDGKEEGKEKTPSLHRLGGGVQQEFEHSFSGTGIPDLSKDWIEKFSWIVYQIVKIR